MKIEKVPNVTMKGGRWIRVTRMPFSRPVKIATTMPISRAMNPGTPWSAFSFAITKEASTIANPIERSTPAVRMIKV